MAIIDTPDLDAQLDAAQAQLTASEAEAKVKESDAEFAKTVKTRRPVTTAASRSSTRPSPASTSIGPTWTACAI
jgi:hypothetical protein